MPLRHFTPHRALRCPAVLAAATLLILFAATPAPAAAAEPPIAFAGVTVLPMTGGPSDGSEARPDHTVLVRGGEIVAVGPAGTLELPPGTVVVEGRGKTLIPGLVDMHVHLPPDDGASAGGPAGRLLAVMLANGVTTARSMAGHPAHLELRRRVESGELLGPTLLLAAPALHQGNTASSAAARAAVRAAREAGYDLVKSHALQDPEVWSAVQEEAARQGLAVAGHVTDPVGLERALAAGQQIEHLDGFVAALLPPEHPAARGPWGQIPPPEVLSAVDVERLPELARRVEASGVWNTPTLALFERITDTDTPVDELRSAEAMRYVSPAALDQWAAQRAQMAASGLLGGSAERFQELRRRVVAALHRAGAPLLAGSDSPQAFVHVGFGLHQELAALVRAGLSPLDALATATREPARYVASWPDGETGGGDRAAFGSVAPGRRADLVLLDRSPADDVGAARAIAGVMVRGRWLDRRRLDRMLAEVEAAGKPAAAAASGLEPAEERAPVFLVRHAEVVPDGDDPTLSERGRARADSLGRLLAAEGVERVLATDTHRARQTAEPLAERLGLAVEEYDPRRLEELAAALRGGAGTGPVVVVGHSNTTPALARALGGDAHEPFGHDEYDRLYRIDPGTGETSLLRYRASRPLALGACRVAGVGAQARCGMLAVPEDRSAPAGRWIALRIVVVPPSEGEAELPPLALLAGGPGQGAASIAPQAAALLAPLRTGRELLLVDQRGTGGSNPLHCRLAEDPAAALGTLGGVPEERVRECRERLSVRADLSRYTTLDAADDLEAVRQALGIPTLDLFGMSYGSRLALEYLRRHPGSVHAVVIRAAAPLDLRLPLWTARDAQRSLERVIAACEDQPRCAAAYPGLAGDVESILRRLDEGPVSVTVPDPRDGSPLEARLDRGGFAGSLFFLLYVPELYVHLPRLVHAAAEGDFRPLVATMVPTVAATLEHVAWGMRWSVVCNEDVVRIDPDEVEAATAGTFFGPLAVQADLDACRWWPRAELPDEFFEPAATDTPLLVISGGLDPVAPPRWGELVADRFAGARHLVAPAASHMPVLPGCTAELARRFLEAGRLEEGAGSCLEPAEPPAFVVTD